MLTQVLEATLGASGSLNYNEIEHPARSGDGNVILAVNYGEITKSAHDATVCKISPLLRCIDNGQGDT